MNIKIDTNNCRVCLQSAGKGQPLFAEATQFAQKYSYCTQLKATKDDGLPELICSKCIARLKIAYDFRKQSLSTEQHLRKFLAALNSKPVEDADDEPELDDAAYEARLLAEAEAEELAAAAEAAEEASACAKPASVPEIPLGAIKVERSVSLKRPASTLEAEQDPLPVAPAPATSQRLGTRVLKVEPELLIVQGTPQAQSGEKREQPEALAAGDEELIASDNDLYHVVVQEVEIAQEYVYDVEQLADGAEGGGEGQHIVPDEDMNEEHLLEEDDEQLMDGGGADDDDEQEEEDEDGVSVLNEDSYSVAESMIRPPAPKKARVAARKGAAGGAKAAEPAGAGPIVGQVHVCQLCNKDFSTRTNLLRHIHTHDGSKPYKCTLCDSAFTQNGSLKQHMHIHTGQRPYECEFCGRGFTQSKSLTFHMRRHTGEKPYQCVECGLSFRQKDGLKRHTSVRHPDGSARSREFPCDICAKVLKSRYSLNLHRRRHEDQALRDEEEGRLMNSSPPGSALVMFSCEQCTRTFSTQASLVAHRRQHMVAEKQAAAAAANGGRAAADAKLDHRCPQCGEQCANRGELNGHMKTVHREGAVLDEVLGDAALEVQKPFECRVCGQRFALEVHRAVHMKAVHGKRCKQFACSRCNKAYAIKANLLAHMARHEANDLAGGDPMDISFESTTTNTTTNAAANSKQQQRRSNALLDDDDDEEEDEFEDEEYALDDDVDALEDESVLGVADGHQLDDGRTQQIFECTDCNMGFTQTEALREHRRIEHGAEADGEAEVEAETVADESCMCDACDTLFVDMVELEAHILDVHGGEQEEEGGEKSAAAAGKEKTAVAKEKTAALKCDRCDEQFAEQKTLDEHQLEHDLTDGK